MFCFGQTLSLTCGKVLTDVLHPVSVGEQADPDVDTQEAAALKQEVQSFGLQMFHHSALTAAWPSESSHVCCNMSFTVVAW